MANLVKVKYAGPEADEITELFCRMCDHDFLNAPFDIECFGRDLVAHYRDAHGIPLEVGDDAPKA